MGKITTYLIIMSGLMLLFHFAGLVEIGATPNSVLLNLLLDPSSFNTGSFYAQVALIFTGLGAIAGVIVGILTKNIELAVYAPFGAYMFTLLWDFVAVFNVIRTENQVIAILLFAPILFVFVITIIDWIRRHD